jgi:hypothetical protein
VPQVCAHFTTRPDPPSSCLLRTERFHKIAIPNTTNQGMFREHYEYDKPFWSTRAVGFECREHSGNIQGICREHPGNMQGTYSGLPALLGANDLSCPDSRDTGRSFTTILLGTAAWVLCLRKERRMTKLGIYNSL